MLADWDAAIDASDEHERQLVEASKRVDAVLSERERFERLVEADRNGGVEAASSRGACGWRGWRASRGSGSARWPIGSSSPRRGSDRCSRGTAGSCAGARSTTTRSPRCCASRPDRALRREAWEASKSIGPHAAPLVRELAHLRNQAAQRARLSRPLRVLADARRARRDLAAEPAGRPRGRACRRPGSAPRPRSTRASARVSASRAGETLQAWDYADAFFQDAPTASDDPLEAALEHLDPVEVARAYFQALGDDVDGVIARSDLYPRDGKNQHAFCADIDRRHDVRVLANCEPGTRWLGDDGARARARGLRPRDRRAAAVAAAPARAHVHDRGDRDAARAAGARRGVPRALRPRRARRSRAIRATPRCSAASCSSSRPGCRS